MTDAVRRLGRARIDFVFGPKPRPERAAAEFRLAELRRTASAQSRKPGLAALRASPPRHVLWREGVARIHEV